MSTETQMLSCPSCGAELAPGSGSCAGCGAAPKRGETRELPAEPVLPDPRLRTSGSDLPPTIHLAHRRPMGIHPVPLLGGLGGASLLLAVILLATGALVAGLVLLALGLALLAMFRSATRREPEAPAGQQALRVMDRCGSALGLIAVSLRAGGRAALGLLRIRTRQWQLRSEFRGRLTPLGEAVYRDDHPRARALKLEAMELEQRLKATQNDATAVRGAARREIRRERAAGEPTEVLSVPPE